MKKTEESLYFNIYQKITTDIRSKRLLANTKLPSVRKAAAFYNVSCNTIQNAYNQLLDEGYIYSKEKKGYFVSDFQADLVEKQSLQIKKTEKKSISPATKAKEKSYISLEANITDTSFFPYCTLRQLYREVLSQKNNEILEHSGNFQGEESLRNAIAQYLYSHRNVNCSSEQILIGGGTSDLLQLLIRLFNLKETNKNQEAAFTPPVFFLETPGFSTIKKIIKDTGCKSIDIPVTEEGADLQTILSQSQKYENQTCLLHLTPAHQFPTGITMPAPRRSLILKWAAENKNRYIIEDDYDSDFRYKGIPIPSMQGFDTNQKVIYMGTFSRTLTPALRISYIVLPQSLMDLYKENYSYYKCPVPRIEQQVLADFIHGGYYERHINRAKKIYRSRRDLMLELLYKHFPQIEVQGEQSGLHFIVRIPDKTEEEILQIAESNHICLKGTGTGWLIIGYGHLKEEEITSLFEKINQKN